PGRLARLRLDLRLGINLRLTVGLRLSKFLCFRHRGLLSQSGLSRLDLDHRVWSFRLTSDPRAPFCPIFNLSIPLVLDLGHGSVARSLGCRGPKINGRRGWRREGGLRAADASRFILIGPDQLW